MIQFFKASKLSLIFLFALIFSFPAISIASVSKNKIYTIPNPVSNGPLLRANSAEAVCAAFSGAYKWPDGWSPSGVSVSGAYCEIKYSNTNIKPPTNNSLSVGYGALFECPANSTGNASGTCNCEADFEESDNQCKPKKDKNPCGDGKHEEGGACVPDTCKPGEIRVGGFCMADPDKPKEPEPQCKADKPGPMYPLSVSIGSAMCEGGCVVVVSNATVEADGQKQRQSYQSGGKCNGPMEPGTPGDTGGNGGDKGGDGGGKGGDGGGKGDGGDTGGGGTGGGGGGGGGGDNGGGDKGGDGGDKGGDGGDKGGGGTGGGGGGGGGGDKGGDKGGDGGDKGGDGGGKGGDGGGKGDGDGGCEGSDCDDNTGPSLPGKPGFGKIGAFTQPKLYERKYKDGPGGVWKSKMADIKNAPISNLVGELMPNIQDGGTPPSWIIDLNFGRGLDYGSHDISPPGWLWGVLRAITILSALLLARRLIFGG